MTLGLKLIAGSWYGVDANFLKTAVTKLSLSKDILTINGKAIHVFGVVFQDPFTLFMDATIINMGRNEKNNIWINDPHVSKYHGKLFKVASKWFVEDSNSTNGTFVNESRITQAVELKRGDKIRIDNTVLEVFFH